MEVISERVLREKLSKSQSLDGVYTHDSKTTPSVQLCDLLIGAILAAREKDAASAAELAVIASIAAHLGWPNLEADTRPTERKFNIWVFYDPTRGKRKVVTREVTLRYPLPMRKRTRLATRV